MNRRGDDTLWFAAVRFMVSILAQAGPLAFGPKSKMWRLGIF
jgi:hypothetical protein